MDKSSAGRPGLSKIHEIILLGTLIALAAVTRFTGLGKFTSIDEPFWLRVSGNFYYALGQKEFQYTIYEYHPAVTTMWIISAGLLAYFPAYRWLGEGYLKPNKFDAFLLEHGKSMLQLLIASRTIQVIVLLVLLLIMYFLLRALFGAPTALFTTGFISISPYFLGQSRLLNHEAMLASFSVIALLAILVYLHVSRKLWLVLLAGAATGLAQLTKSSGIAIFPVIGLAILIAAVGARDRKLGAALLDGSRTLAVWLAATAAAYVLFWPGMWVAPREMLSDVYGNALAYMFAGSRLDASPGLYVATPPLVALQEGLRVYLNDLEWRNTLLSWIGFALGLAFAIWDLRKNADKRQALLAFYAVSLGALFVVLFGAQRGPKPPHYILTAYVCMDLIAGLGFARLAMLLLAHTPQPARMWLPAAFLIAIIAIQLVLSVGSYPYYITYYDPVVQSLKLPGHNPTLDGTGYGVGLDQAAAYLAAKPDAAHMMVMSANARGSFSYYFPGESYAMNAYVLSSPSIVDFLSKGDYVVVDYYNQTVNGQTADLQGVQPEKVIRINGIDFLHIYRTADLKANLPAAKP